MTEAANCIPMSATVEISRYDRETRKSEPLRAWMGHALINLVYGMLDQATAWRTKAGGHKFKAKRWNKTVLHYAMFGVLPMNAYHNMKMANENDKRTYRGWKKSLCRYSMLKAPALGLRERNRKTKPKMRNQQTRTNAVTWRQTTNPHKTEVGSLHNFSVKLKAAAVCNSHSIRRSVPLSALPKYADTKYPRLYCHLCASRGISKRTSWCYTSCGGAYCIAPATWGRNNRRNLISCMDASHQPNKICLTTLKVKKN